MALIDLQEPTQLNLRVIKGDSFSRTLTITNNGTAIDLTGYTATAQARTKGKRVIADFIVSIPTPTSGEIELSLPTTATRSLTSGGIWDLQLVLDADPENNTHTIVRGTIELIPDVTI